MSRPQLLELAGKLTVLDLERRLQSYAARI
jgi:hypothetical protein